MSAVAHGLTPMQLLCVENNLLELFKCCTSQLHHHVPNPTPLEHSCIEAALATSTAQGICGHVQKCAHQILGNTPVVFPDGYAGICENVYNYIYDKDKYKYMWEHKRGYNQWWIDALSVDPSKLLTDVTGLWELGTPHPISNTKLENANIGTLPNIQVYIAVHAVHGTHAFFSWHGAKHGGLDKDGKKTLYKEFNYWFDDLTEQEKRDIVAAGYCNSPKGLKNFRKKASKADIEAFESGPFDQKWFLVSSTETYHVPRARQSLRVLSKCCIAIACQASNLFILICNPSHLSQLF